MKVHSCFYKDEVDLEYFISSHEINSQEHILVQIFSGVIDSENAIYIAKLVKNFLPNAHILGTSTSGELINGLMYEEHIVISFSVFEHTSIRSKLYHFNSDFDITLIQKEIIQKDTVALIVFSDGLESDAEHFIKELHSINQNITIAGGRAGDNATFVETFIFNAEEKSENGCVIASLNGKELQVYNDYFLNWTPIGKEMLVTKVEGSTLYELDGTSIIELYRKYLGDDVVRDLPRSSMPFPLILQKGNICVARDPIRVKGDAMVYAGSFEIGDIVRFSFANIEDLTDNLDRNFHTLSKNPAEGIYIYSCTARKALLKEKLLDEFSVLNSLAPTVGFFTYGEFFQSTHIAEVLNVTTTFLMLSESKKIEKKVFQEIKIQEFDPVKKALTHLVKVTTKELEHLSTHDVLTSLYNRQEYIKVMSKQLKTAQRYKENFGLILIDIDHFKQVNDTYGHNVGDKVLIAFAHAIVKSVRADDFVGRWGGEEFVVIVKHAGKKELEVLVKKLQKAIANIHVKNIKNLSASFGVTVYKAQDSDESIFKRVDGALYIAKQTGRNRSIFK